MASGRCRQQSVVVAALELRRLRADKDSAAAAPDVPAVRFCHWLLLSACSTSTHSCCLVYAAAACSMCT